jgi:hypothetical protein
MFTFPFLIRKFAGVIGNGLGENSEVIHQGEEPNSIRHSRPGGNRSPLSQNCCELQERFSARGNFSVTLV